MTRHLSVRFAIVVSSIVVACAGCAAHPERPSAAPVHAEATPPKPPPHLFDGCKVLSTEAKGWGVGCGHTLGKVATYPGVTKDKALAADVDSFGKSVKGDMRTSKGTVTLGGQKREATEVRMYRTPKDKDPWFMGYFVGFDSPDGAVVVFCGSGSAKGVMRCPAMLTWFAAHPTTAPVISDGPWPPPSKVVIPTGCHRVEAQAAHEMDLGCPDVALMIVRLADHTSNPGVYQKAAVAMGKQFLANAKANHGTNPVITPLACAFTGRPAACGRLRVTTEKGQGEIVFGVGEMYGETVLVQCFEPATGDTPPPECTTFLQLTAAP